MDIKQVEVIFTGRVQGVGFRYTAESLAVKYGVVGYVKNLSDGGVEVVGEGKEKNLKPFLDAIQNEMGRYIIKSNINWFPPEGNFKSFSIRY